MIECGIVKVAVAKSSQHEGHIPLRIVIPKLACKQLDLKKGDYISIIYNNNRLICKRVQT